MLLESYETSKNYFIILLFLKQLLHDINFLIDCQYLFSSLFQEIILLAFFTTFS